MYVYININKMDTKKFILDFEDEDIVINHSVCKKFTFKKSRAKRTPQQSTKPIVDNSKKVKWSIVKEEIDFFLDLMDV